MQKQDTKTATTESEVKHIKKIEAQPADANGQQKPEIRTAGGCIPVGV
jgi:hypothetical protein